MHFTGYGNYHDPKLTWEITVGRTSLTSTDSVKLGGELDNDLSEAKKVESQTNDFNLAENIT